MQIGQKIKELRRKLNLTQKELAEKANISRSYLADVENNRYNPSIGTLKALAHCLNSSLGELVSGDEKLTEAVEDFYYESEDKKNEIEEREKLLKQKYDAPITDVKHAMEVILAQPGLMLNGEMLSDESKIALANAIQMGLAYAEQMQKKEKEQKENK